MNRRANCRMFLEEKDIVAAIGKQMRRHRTGGATADHYNVAQVMLGQELLRSTLARGSIIIEGLLSVIARVLEKLNTGQVARRLPFQLGAVSDSSFQLHD